MKMVKSYPNGRKHGKWRNCSLRAISPFPTVFSKDLYCRHVKTRACLGKGLECKTRFFYISGVHLVHTVGYQKTPFKWCLLGACIGTPWLLMKTQSLVMSPLAAAVIAHKKSKWDPYKRQRKGCCSFFQRIFVLSMAGFIYFSMWTSVVYFNVHVTTSEGEQVPIYEAVNNFFRSPAWKEMKKTLNDLYTLCQTNGWGTCYERFIESMDPAGEASAYSVSIPITRRQILDSSKLKEFADDNFKFDENGSKLSKRVENTWEKEKSLVTGNFSFSHSVFKRLVSQGHQKVSLCGNGLILSQTTNFSLFQNERVCRQ